MRKKGLVIVLSGPSGSGKGTVLSYLKEMNKNIRSSISVTTRKPRELEQDGEHYYFRTVEEFKEMIENNELIEWVRYCDNYYGTPMKRIEETINEGFDIVIEIEVEGAMNIIKRYPDCVPILILPPSFDDLRNRISKRGSEDETTIKKRLARASSELTYSDKYRYVIVNEQVEKAATCITSILSAEKCRVARNKEFLKKFLQEG